ncbi:MAG TPA: MogA/MoaB family molybdenum cofactor biosynthesis protein [Dehalococcoidia bacterium]|nr:MogA/MoaB family molybdenum cofactor biosynthesis protein [Dehalococcoidia bacterium]
MAIRAGVLTVSDKGSRGERVDTAGPAVAAMLREAGMEVVETAVIADIRWEIAPLLKRWADEVQIELILTTGGTGLSPRDVTPEATLDVAERQVPGIAEVMREEGRKSTHLAALSRAVVVTRGHSLIVNLPGSERGARESLQAVLELLPHAVELLQGDAGEQHPVGETPGS